MYWMLFTLRWEWIEFSNMFNNYLSVKMGEFLLIISIEWIYILSIIIHVHYKMYFIYNFHACRKENRIQKLWAWIAWSGCDVSSSSLPSSSPSSSSKQKEVLIDILNNDRKQYITHPTSLLPRSPCNQIRCGASLTVTLFSTLLSFVFSLHAFSVFEAFVSMRLFARVCHFNPSRYHVSILCAPIKSHGSIKFQLLLCDL